MQIIAARKNDDIDVQFLDEHRVIKEHNTYRNFRIGQIKNPYDRSVCGVGCIGEGKYLLTHNKKNLDIYNVWMHMIERCYFDNGKHPAYLGICTVCDEWLNFQVFAQWYEDHWYFVKERLHLDKDILYPGNKIYSPKTCMLVPQRINELFCINTRKDDGLPQGIKRTNANTYNASYGCKNLGTYNTYEEACEKYVIEKEKKIKEVADEYKDIIPSKLYDVLVNYKVEIAM